MCIRDRVKTGNLWISIPIHMLVNSVSVLGNFLSLYAGYEIGSLLYQISCWAGGLLALILFASALAKRLRPLSLDRGILPELSRSRRAGMLFGNTGAIAIILYLSLIHIWTGSTILNPILNLRKPRTSSAVLTKSNRIWNGKLPWTACCVEMWALAKPRWHCAPLSSA